MAKNNQGNRYANPLFPEDENNKINCFCEMIIKYEPGVY